MSSKNIAKLVKNLSKHITNFNQTLKRIKLNTFVDFIYTDYHGLIITSNQVVSQSDLDVIEKYMKNINLVGFNNVQNACSPQSKSYLKILGIPYFIEGTDMSMDSSVIETIIKYTHIFNNTYIASKPQVIKVSSKLDMVIV